MSLVDTSGITMRVDMTNTEAFTAMQSVRLNRELVENMIEGRTKPFPDQEFLKIKNDNVAIMFTLLDTIMADKSTYERLGTKIIREDLEMVGTRYNKRNLRKPVLETLVQGLNGRRISSGVLKAVLLPAASGKDDKIRFTKTPYRQRKQPKVKPINSTADAEAIAQEILDGLGQIGSIGNANWDLPVHVCKCYKFEMLPTAVAVVKADLRGKINSSAIQAFMDQVHRMAHERKLEWVSKCDTDCSITTNNLKLL